MIRLKNVSFRYEAAKEPSLRDIDFTVKRGEFVILTGLSGCGKTTLTRVLNGLCPQFYGGELTGSYTLDGRDTDGMTLNEIGKKIGNVFQDPRSQFFATNTTDETALAMENRNYSPALMRSRINETADMLGIRELLDRDIFGLSSGEKQKIAIAAACCVHPNVLILDEPSANLDPESTLQLVGFLKTLKELGLTIIVSEHRLYYLSELADRMIVMENGRIKCEFSHEEMSALTEEKMTELGLRLLTLPEVKKPERRSQRENSFLTVDDVTFVRGRNRILSEFSMSAERRKILAITGRNGVGKSTLCKVITGIYRERSGSVLFYGGKLSPRKRVNSSFFVGQDADYQLYGATAREELLINMGKSTVLEEKAEKLLTRFDLSEFSMRHPASLSGGQKQRLLIAAAIIRERPLLVLDEPTSGLDGKHMRDLAVLLREAADSGLCILIVTHDTEFIALAADEVMNLQRDK